MTELTKEALLDIIEKLDRQLELKNIEIDGYKIRIAELEKKAGEWNTTRAVRGTAR